MSKQFNPKVSIVIPVYNGSNYLREAIDSALAQTYKNIEVIVINDGSNDKGKTDKICKSYGNRIRYFKKENGGVSSALNMGIDKMKGEYFSWLSHDDVYYPNKIEKQIKYLYDKKLDKKIIIFCNYELINEKGEHTSFVEFDHEMLIAKPEYALLRGSINGITLLIPREALDRKDKFRNDLKCTQDYEMWNRLVKGYKFIHMPDILTKTRIHAEQDSNKHPNVVLEGDPLWIDMMEGISDEGKIRLEGTIYNFYKEMATFLATTPYVGALNHAEKRMEEIYREKREEISKIKVTVVIPFYNRINLLLKSLKSVTDQTHENLEILLVNDGSTEDLALVGERVKEDERIKILTLKENKGPAAARNLGLRSATGKYIAFLDSDDLFLDDKIEKQLSLMFLTDYKISHTSYIRRGKYREEILETGLLQGIVVPKIISNCPIATPTVMLQNDYLKKNDIKFNEELRIGEDICFWLEILKGQRLLGITSALTIVNTNENSAANSLEKAIKGISNILSFVLSDKDLSKYHAEISLLCRSYIEISQQLSEQEVCLQSVNLSLWDKKPQKAIPKLLFLFKTQGVITTIRKIARKYLR